MTSDIVTPTRDIGVGARHSALLRQYLLSKLLSLKKLCLDIDVSMQSKLLKNTLNLGSEYLEISAKSITQFIVLSIYFL
jgi:hypothetical protein